MPRPPKSDDERARDALVRKNLRKFREESGLSQVELALLADIKPNTYPEWEREKSRRAPKADALKRLADALGRKIDDFYSEEPPPVDRTKISPVVRYMRARGPAQYDPEVQAILADIHQRFADLDELWTRKVREKKS